MRQASPGTVALAEAGGSLLDLLLIAAAIAWTANTFAPSQDLPWKPLRFRAPVGFATRLQLARAAADPAACRRALREGDIAFADAPAERMGFCTTENTLWLESGVTALRPTKPKLSCPEALAYALWMRDAVQPAARRLLGSAVVQVDHYGSYACRTIYSETHGAPSEHARANALDVAAFRLADGRRVSVAADFPQPTARGRFIRLARDGACQWFHGVYSPDYNAAHRDHLHLDFGPYRLCS